MLSRQEISAKEHRVWKFDIAARVTFPSRIHDCSRLHLFARRTNRIGEQRSMRSGELGPPIAVTPLAQAAYHVRRPLLDCRSTRIHYYQVQRWTVAWLTGSARYRAGQTCLHIADRVLPPILLTADLVRVAPKTSDLIPSRPSLVSGSRHSEGLTTLRSLQTPYPSRRNRRLYHPRSPLPNLFIWQSEILMAISSC